MSDLFYACLHSNNMYGTKLYNKISTRTRSSNTGPQQTYNTQIGEGFSNARSLMNEIARKLNIRDPQDWYQITWKTLLHQGARSLLRKYDGSPSKLLQNVYPEYSWDLSKFSTVPRKYWSSITNQRNFMNQIVNKFNIALTGNWHILTKTVIQQHGGAGCLQKYQQSPSKLLVHVYPEYKQTCKDFLLNIVQDLKLSSVEDVLHVPLEYLKARNPMIMQSHNNSVSKCTPCV